MLAVTGFSSTIVQALRKSGVEDIVRIGRNELPPFSASHYLLAAGLLHQASVLDQSPLEQYESVLVNMIRPLRLCEMILRANTCARICVVGSESGIKGSFDEVYATSKAGIMAYVKWRKLLPTQQLFAVAPTVISDSGMTMRRKDYPGVLSTRKTITAQRVAEVIRQTLLLEPVESSIRNGVVEITA